jgi:autotransporter-associated beta strand protein
MKKLFLRLVLSSGVAFLSSDSAFAQISLNGSAYSQNFDSMGSAGTQPPSGWLAGSGTAALTQAAALMVGTGSASNGTNYNFGSSAATDRALGSVAASSTQRNTEVRFVNNTGGFITAFTIDYTGEQWRCGGTAAVANSLTMQYSTDGTTWVNMGGTFDFTGPTITGPTAAMDGNLTANRTTGRGGVYTPASPIANGATFYLRWADIDNTSNDHGLAVDDFSISTTHTTLQYWDNDGSTAGIGGTGIWDGSSLNWNGLADGTAATVAFDSSKTAAFGGTAGTVTVDVGGVTANGGLAFSADGYIVGGGTVTVGSVNSISVDASQTATINSALAGSSGLTKAGAGTLVLTGANTLSGAVSVLAGTLAVNGGSAIADDSTVSLSSSTLRLDASETVGAVGGSGTVSLNNTSITISNSVASTLAANLSITGNGSFIKKGAGNLTLSSTNSLYAGTTRLEEGTLTVNGTVPLGKDTNTLEFAGGGLAMSVSRTITNPVSMTGNVLLSSPGLSSGTRTMTFLSGTFDNTAGTITIRNTGTGGTNSVRLREGSLNITRDIVIGQVGDLGGAILRCDHQSGGDQIISGNISGPGIFERNSNLSLYGYKTILTGNNTYSGTTHLKGGFIGVGSANALGTGDVRIGTDTTHMGLFAYGGAREITNSVVFDTTFSASSTNLHFGGSEPLTLSGPVVLHTANSSHLNVSNSALTTISGVISGGATIGITKVGSGVLALTGNNTYGGATLVSGGTLLANGAADSTGTGAVVVNAGGTLGGTGVISGAVTLNDGATIAAGASVESLDTGSQTWSGGATNVWEITDATGGAGVGGDVINITGSLTNLATGGNKFTIYISAATPPANFDNTQTYQWTIVTTTAGIVGFDESTFNVVQTGFNGAGFGTFRVAQDGNNLVLRFVFPPVVTTHPASQTVFPGDSATFSVIATGSPTLTYQWKKDGSPILDATTTSYTINPVSGTDAGSYTVVVTNGEGAATSNPAVLSVSPVITVEPVGGTRSPGGNITFSVTAQGQAPLSYFWRKNAVEIPGANASAYTIDPIQGAHAGSYSVIVSNAAGIDTSIVADLIVAPDITSQPGNVTEAVEDTATFSVTVTGTTPFTYAWKKGASPLSNGGRITGADGPTLQITDLETGDAGSYSVEITNAGGTTNSTAATLTVTSVPVITEDPESLTVAATSNAVFTVTATGSGTLTYLWKKGGNGLSNTGKYSGVDTATLTISNVSQDEVGSYSVTVSNEHGGDDSTAATLTVIDPPLITTQPASLIVTNGDPAAFSVVASGSAAAYQWKKGGVDIANATTDTLTINSATLADAGNYTVVLSNFAAVVTSDTATLTVLQAPDIMSQPQNTSVARSASAILTVTATGYPLNYQWSKNGTNIAGATTSALTFASVQSSDIGYYSVVVSNDLGSETSTSALLSINSTLYSESFDADVTSQWTTRLSHANAFANYFFDYSTLGIPPATNSSGGSTRGMRFLVNQSAGIQQGIVGYPTGKGFSGNYRLRFDMWLNFNGPAPGGGSGSTQVGSFGIGATGATALWAGSSPNGVMFGTTGEGGSSIDYRVYYNNALRPVTDGVYAAGTTPGVSDNNTDPYYAVFGGETAPASMVALYPQQTGATTAGAVGWKWRDVVVEKNGNTITWSIDSLLLGTVNVTNVTTFSTNIFLGMFDINAGSSTDVNDLLIASIYDNVRVENIDTLVPVIASQPANITNNAGTTAVFTVGVTSASAVRYQWRYNGNDIAGATSSALSLNDVLAANAGSYDVLVLNENSAVLSDAATLTVIDPAINTQPQSITRALTTTAEFTVVANGTGTLTYQWKKGASPLSDGGDISGATTATLSIANLEVSDAGSYQVEVTGLTTVVSDVATLTVNDPGIVSDPVNQTVGAGGTASFSVAAAGSGTLTYQWQYNEESFTDFDNYSGANTPTLTITNVSQVDAANYRCIVSNATGSVTSGSATLTVIDSPVIVTHPGSITNNFNTTATLTVAATGSGLSYQWKKGGVNIDDGGNISGATTATLTMTAVSGADAGLYRAAVTTLGGTILSDEATVTIIDPLFTSHPANRTVSAGDRVTFSAVATGSPAITYQWQHNTLNLSDSATILGATSTSLTNNLVDADDAGNYTLVATNDYSSQTSSNGVLTVTGSLLKTIARWDFNSTTPDATSSTGSTTPSVGAGSIAVFGGVGPVSSTFSGGGSADPASSDNTAFHTTAYRAADPNKSAGFQANVSTAGRENLVIAWYQQVSSTGSKYWRLQYSTDGSTFTDADVITVNTAGTMEYKVVDLSAISGVDNNENFALRIVTEFEDTATGAGGSAYIRASGTGLIGDTGTARFDLLTVFGDIIPAAIVTHPATQTVGAGSDVTLTVEATGGSLSYQWKKDGFDISGETTSALTLTDVLGADAASYTVQITNPLGQDLLSDPAVLTVLDPYIATQPQNITVGLGTNFSFSVTAYGTSLTYQWKKNGVNITGATSTTYGKAAATADAATYTVAVTGFGATTVLSSGAVLTVDKAPTISGHPLNATKFAGQTNMFKVTATGGSLTYQWRFGGNPISGATSSTYTVDPVVPAAAGAYDVIVANSAGSITSNPGTLTVNTDITKPAIVVTYPKASGIYTDTTIPGVTNYVFLISGKATDNARVTNVVYSINGGSEVVAPITGPINARDWTGSITVVPGTNILTVKAWDFSGVQATDKIVKFYYHVQSTFTYALNTEGVSSGTIKSNGSVAMGYTTNNAPLFVGRSYKIISAVGAGTN